MCLQFIGNQNFFEKTLCFSGIRRDQLFCSAPNSNSKRRPREEEAQETTCRGQKQPTVCQGNEKVYEELTTGSVFGSGTCSQGGVCLVMI